MTRRGCEGVQSVQGTVKLDEGGQSDSEEYWSVSHGDG